MFDRVWMHYAPGFGVIRVSTVITVLLMLVWVGILRRRPALAVFAVAGWLVAFEILFNWSGTIALGWSWRTSARDTALWGGWVLAAYLVGVRPEIRLVGLAAVFWVVWLVTGFHFNLVGNPGISWPAEAINEATKTALAAAFLVGALKAPAADPAWWPANLWLETYRRRAVAADSLAD
ncbi:MAG TPA: hypothetical protein VGG90_10375 [Candidatus Dormibacteraeota bacterium]|jgi:hypothetical protein